MRQNKLMSTKKTASLNGVSESWLSKNWRRLPGAHRAGRVLRWDVEELRNWMKERAQEGISKEAA